MTWEGDLERGNAHADRGDHERAIAAFRDAENSGGPDLGLNIGNSLRALGETEKAREAFAGAWAEGDRDAGFNLGSLLESAGDEAALQVYRELAESGYVKAAVNGAGMLMDAGRYEEAAALLVDHVDDPVWADAVRAVLGAVYWRAGRLDAAESLLRQAAGADAHARADLGHLLLDSDRRDEAVQEWEAGAAQSQPESMVPLANLLAREGDSAAAARLYERAYELGDAVSRGRIDRRGRW